MTDYGVVIEDKGNLPEKIDWPTRPMDAQWTRKAILWWVGQVDNPAYEKINPGMQGVVTGTLNKLYGSDGKDGDAKRKIVLWWLFGDPEHPRVLSSKELTDAQWFALYRWIKPSRVMDDKNKIMWIPHPKWQTEALFVLAQAMKEFLDYQHRMAVLAGVDGEQ